MKDLTYHHTHGPKSLKVCVVLLIPVELVFEMNIQQIVVHREGHLKQYKTDDQQHQQQSLLLPPPLQQHCEGVQEQRGPAFLSHLLLIVVVLTC